MMKASAPTLFAGEGGVLRLGMVSAAGGIAVAPGGTSFLSTKCWNLLGLGKAFKGEREEDAGSLGVRWRGRCLI